MLKMARKVLCLDWDKRSLRLVAARVGGGRMVLEDAHSHRLPLTLDADDPAALGEFIQQMMRRHRLRSKMVLVDVPRERTVINLLTLPPTPENEVAAAVRFQAMRELPFPLDSAAADYVITKRDEQGLVREVLLAAVTLETLNRVRATCEAAGLTPARIGLRPYANLISVRHVAQFQEKRVLFVDVGPGATEIDVFAGEALAFARSANVNVPVPGPGGAAGEDSRIISLAEITDLASDETIDAAVDELLVEVTRTLQAFRATEPEATIDRVVVAGGTGIEERFAEALHGRLGYPVEMFDPTGPLRVSASEASKLRSFSAALGLAWGLSQEGLLALDFLNPKRPVSSRETLQRRVRMGVLAASVLLVVLAGAYGRYYWTLMKTRDTLVQANNALKKTVGTKEAIEKQIQLVKEWADAPVWPEDLLAITEKSIEPGKKMLVGSVELRSDDRDQKISLRNVQLADDRLQIDFVRALQELQYHDEPAYKVSPRAFVFQPGGVEFKGKLDFDIELQRSRAQSERGKKSGSSKGRS